MVDMFRDLEYPVGDDDQFLASMLNDMGFSFHGGIYGQQINMDYFGADIRLNLSPYGRMWGSIQFGVKTNPHLFFYRGKFRESFSEVFALADRLRQDL